MPDFEHFRQANRAATPAPMRKFASAGAKMNIASSRTEAADAPASTLAPQRELLQAQRKIVQLELQVTELQRAVADAQQFAYFDALTGLPNRRLLLDRFNQALARGLRQHTQMGLLFLDLDGFKAINDALGHAQGDQLLRLVAERLNACIRATDTACRYGGDEFVVLLTQIESHDRALIVARKIRAAIAKPYLLKKHVVHLTTSIGLAVYPRDGAGYADLIEQSDLAMYFDKARGTTAASYARPGGQPSS